jgi:hypothetical protein
VEGTTGGAPSSSGTVAAIVIVLLLIIVAVVVVAMYVRRRNTKTLKSHGDSFVNPLYDEGKTDSDPDTSLTVPVSSDSTPDERGSSGVGFSVGGQDTSGYMDVSPNQDTPTEDDDNQGGDGYMDVHPKSGKDDAKNKANGDGEYLDITPKTDNRAETTGVDNEYMDVHPKGNSDSVVDGEADDGYVDVTPTANVSANTAAADDDYMDVPNNPFVVSQYIYRTRLKQMYTLHFHISHGLIFCSRVDLVCLGGRQ